MAQCLVTKLKAAVNDNSLKKLGEGRIAIFLTQTTLVCNNSQYSALNFNADCHLKIETSGAYFTDNETTTQNLGTELNAHAASASNKFTIKGTASTFVILTISNYYAMGIAGFQMCDGLNVLKYCANPKNAYPYGTNAQLSEVAKIPTITSVTRTTAAPNGWEKSWRGELKSISVLNLVNVDVGGTVDAYGSLEEFAAGLCTHFPTRSDSCTVRLSASNITLNGVVQSAPHYIKFNGDGTCRITTDSAFNTTVATYNGTTWSYS